LSSCSNNIIARPCTIPQMFSLLYALTFPFPFTIPSLTAVAVLSFSTTSHGFCVVFIPLFQWHFSLVSVMFRWFQCHDLSGVSVWFQCHDLSGVSVWFQCRTRSIMCRSGRGRRRLTWPPSCATITGTDKWPPRSTWRLSTTGEARLEEQNYSTLST
jgi:hypothetical protein